MTRIAVSVAAIGVFVAASLYAQSVDPPLQKAIDSRRAARLARDLTVWGQLTADNALEIHSDGRVHTKQQEMDEIKSLTAAGPDTADTERRVQVFGRNNAIYVYRRNPSDGPRRTSTVWMKNAAGQWQCILTQQSMVAK